MTMIWHRRITRSVWLVSLAVIALVAAHGIVFFYIPSQTTLSAVALSGILILLVIKLALIGGGHALLRRWPRPKRD